MAKWFEFKGYLKNIRIFLYPAILIYIWLQYEYSSGNWTYDNGQSKVSGSHQNGRDEGDWIWYYSNGKKRMEGTFLNGKREGKWILWDIEGNKISETEYKNDKLNGNFIRWNTDGTIKATGIYKDDKIVNITYYDSTGIPK